jgi:tetratricopeptide (TPR) repeat protein
MRALFAGLLLVTLSAPALAAIPEDPNAALRRRTGPPVDPALAEFERVKKINNELAIAHFNAVIQKDPKDVQAYLSRGRAYKENRDYDKALADYDQALALDPKLADAYIGKAVCHFFRNETDKAWESVHKAESLGGKLWPAFMDALKQRSGRQK